MTIQASSVTSKVLRVKSPSATWHDMTGVTFTVANGQASFRFSRSFTHNDSGVWTIWTNSSDRVMDNAGNSVVPDIKIGEFIVNIPVPADVTPPTVTLNSISPATITTAGNVEVNIAVTFVD